MKYHNKANLSNRLAHHLCDHALILEEEGLVPRTRAPQEISLQSYAVARRSSRGTKTTRKRKLPAEFVAHALLAHLIWMLRTRPAAGLLQVVEFNPARLSAGHRQNSGPVELP